MAGAGSEFSLQAALTGDAKAWTQNWPCAANGLGSLAITGVACVNCGKMFRFCLSSAPSVSKLLHSVFMKSFARICLFPFFARRTSARRDHEAGKLATLSVIQFATHLLEAGYDIRTPRELFGHTDVSATCGLHPGSEPRSGRGP